MKLRFEGNICGLEEGIGILGKEIGFEISPDGIPIKVENTEGNIEVGMDQKTGYIQYHKKIHFFRALGLFLEKARYAQKFHITEEPQFVTNGIMYDCSRNAVLNTGSIQSVIRKMAIMGLNMLMLYTEDTYEVEGEPYFGYMRGRYNFEEIKECDDYADAFGIEMIPCIQTLAHLFPVLKWDVYRDIRDDDELLTITGGKTYQFLVGEEKVYTFIEKILKSATAPYRSNRIHIGMDEALGLGLGQYLRKNGYTEGYKIMLYHLNRVVEITQRLNLRPMMWSDMLFKCGSKMHQYYDLDAVTPDEVIQNMPDVDLVYWDYGHMDEGFYREFIRKHKKLGSTPVFAGGILIWGTYGADYKKTFKAGIAALNSCKKEGVKEVFATIWGNDGPENNIFSALPGMQLFAEYGYSRELDMEKLAERTGFCTGIDFDSIMDLNSLDAVPDTGTSGLQYSNTSKYLLWQDILLGLFDKDIEGLHLSAHYENTGNKFKSHLDKYNNSKNIFEIPRALCHVLSIKSEIGIKTREAYINGNRDELRKIAFTHLPELSSRISELRNIHRDQWYRINKPFGWEVLDIQYGGLINRVETAIKRLSDYLEGKIDMIEELEVERLPYNGPVNADGEGGLIFYKRIVTPGLIIY